MRVDLFVLVMGTVGSMAVDAQPDQTGPNLLFWQTGPNLLFWQTGPNLLS